MTKLSNVLRSKQIAIFLQKMLVRFARVFELDGSMFLQFDFYDWFILLLCMQHILPYMVYLTLYDFF